MNKTPLVNCHTHLELSWAGDLCPNPPGVPFSEWVYNLVMTNRQRRDTLENAEAATQTAVEQGIQKLLSAGVTHVGDITSTGLSIEPLLDSGLAGIVYVEVLGLVPGVADFMWDRARQILEEFRPHERNGLRIGLSPHAIYSTLPQTFQAITDYCLREDVPLCIHLAESPAEVEFALHGSGPLFTMPQRFGTPDVIPPFPKMRPVAYLESLGVLEAKPLLVHMVQADDDELNSIARSGAKIAHCPRSNELLQCGRLSLETVLAKGIPVALGTDSLGSSPSLDVREEAEAAITLHNGRLRDEQIHALLQQTAVLD